MSQPSRFIYYYTDPDGGRNKPENYEYYTESGPVASFETNVVAPLRDLTVDIDPVQDLHGYDHPWPAGGGENVFDALAWVTLGGNSNYYAVSSDETITITANDAGGISNRFIDVNPGETYAFLSTFSVNIRIFSSDSQTIIERGSGTFTAPDDGKIAVKFYASSYPTSGNFILVKGSTIPTVWTPYSNVCPITGHTAARVTRCGKNLIDIPDADSTTTNAIDNIANQNQPKWKPNTQYTFSITTKALVEASQARVWYARFFYTDGTASSYGESVICNNQTDAGQTLKQYVVTSRSGKTVERLFFTQGTEFAIKVKDAMLEEGTTATSYEPYTGQVYDITFPNEAGTVYGGTLDVTTGVLTVTHGQIASYAGETLPGEWVSDRDVYAEGTSPSTGAQVVYELATPVTYQLTPTEVKTLLGKNNIWADCGDVTVTYPVKVI